MRARILIFLFIFTVVLDYCNAQLNVTIHGIEYSIKNNSARVGFNINNNVRGDVIIPSSIAYNGRVYPVCGFEESAFWRCHELTSIVIPEGIDSLPYSSFRDCENLKFVSLPSTLKYIGGAAFANCISLDSIFLPEGLAYIDCSAFGGCTNLAKVNIPESMDYGLLDTCGSIPSLFYGENKIQKPLYNSRYFLYMPKSYSGEYIIPETIEAIADCAFEDCKGIVKIQIPNSVRWIGGYAFKGCLSLSSISLPVDVRLNVGVFSGCTNLTYIEFPNGVYCCDGASAFEGCSSIRNAVYNNEQFVYLPKGYEGEFCVPQGVVSIADYAFANCKQLTSVMIDNGVEKIGNGAFAYCTNLHRIKLPNSLIDVSGTCFMGDSLLNEVRNNHLMVYLNEKHKGYYRVPWGVIKICSYAFRGCSELTSIKLPSSIRNIEKCAFLGCSKIKSITIPVHVQTLGIYAFERCNDLQEIHVLAKTPPVITDTQNMIEDMYSFWLGDNINKKIPVYVPSESLRLYQSAPFWSELNLKAR